MPFEPLKIDFFKLVFSPEMTEHYDFYNKAHFKGRLPPMRIYYGPLKEKTPFKYGVTAFTRRNRALYIVLNKKLKGLGKEVSCLVLLHEMLHVKLEGSDSGHGRLFHREKRRLLLAGAFDDLI